MFFLLLFAVLIILAAGGMFYLYTRVIRFNAVKKLGTKGKILAWTLPAATVFAVVFALRMSFINAIIIIIHLMVFWAVCDLVSYTVQKISKKQATRYYAGLAAIAITVVYFVAGWYSAHHVVRTDYEFTTDKSIKGDGLRIVQITDSHLGVTLDGEDFAREVEKIQSVSPDIVVVTGDFVDDDTEHEDMITACKALGGLKTKYGVYFVYGNHDEGYFDSRDFSGADMEHELISNGVIVLCDETVFVGDSFYLVGRLDRSSRDRKDIHTLVDGIDKSKYTIVLDHQPNDYKNEADASVDLVLSGHTHGGHIFPAGPIGVLIGSNDRYYGTETRGNTSFVVSSGISGWAIPFKTGTVSEYVVIDINK